MGTWTRYPSLAGQLAHDVASLLERYCLLGRIGDFSTSQEIWDMELKEHASSFLFAISYIDTVLRQSRYGHANDYLREYHTTVVDAGKEVLLPSQLKILSIMQAYLHLFTRGWLRAAVTEARSTFSWLSATKAVEYDDYQVFPPSY